MHTGMWADLCSALKYTNISWGYKKFSIFAWRPTSLNLLFLWKAILISRISYFPTLGYFYSLIFQILNTKRFPGVFSEFFKNFRAISNQRENNVPATSVVLSWLTQRVFMHKYVLKSLFLPHWLDKIILDMTFLADANEWDIKLKEKWIQDTKPELLFFESYFCFYAEKCNNIFKVILQSSRLIITYS